MANKSHHISLYALAYAQSLLDLANDSKQPEPIGGELRDIRQIVIENPVFGAFLSDPGISETERGEVLKKLFEGKASPLMFNFLRVLNAKGRLRSIVEIADAYDHLLDEQMGKVEVDVTVPQKLTSPQLEEVRQRVSAALKKDAVVHQYVDPNIIGGLLIRVQDKLIDASVKTQLAMMRQQLLASAPR